MIAIILEKAGEVRAKRVSVVNVKAGALSGVEKTALEFAFEQVAKNTIAEKAALLVEILPATMRCLECKGDFKLAGGLFECPACSSREVELVSGQELFIDSIDVED
jgi:hydrogenase nickel incorporation protein HypA/HybF